MRILSSLLLLAGLTACATPAPPSGLLSRYDQLQPRSGTVRAKLAEHRDDAGLAQVRRVALEPAALAQNERTAWLSQAERELLLREVDAQLCFELSERYAIAGAEEPAPRVRAIVTDVRPTGRLGSAASAAAGFFIPGPIGVRVPGGLGGLAAEAEMLGPDGRQLAAIAWSRRATAVGVDNPSLSRVGDALQFAEPFADAAAATMTASGVKPPGPPKPDPCARYGPRLRVGGVAARMATGLYVPQMSGARKEAADGQ